MSSTNALVEHRSQGLGTVFMLKIGWAALSISNLKNNLLWAREDSLAGDVSAVLMSLMWLPFFGKLDLANIADSLDYFSIIRFPFGTILVVILCGLVYKLTSGSVTPSMDLEQRLRR